MIRLVEFLKGIDEEGVKYLGEIIGEFENDCNFEYFILNDYFKFSKWHEITRIVTLDKQVNEVAIITDMSDLLSRIIEQYKDFDMKEEYQNSETKEIGLGFYKRKSKLFFLSEISKEFGLD